MFKECYSLKKLTMPYTNGSSGEFEKFRECSPIGFWLSDKSDYEYFYETESFNKENSSYVYIPKTLTEIIITDGTKIPEGAFSGLSSLTSITIPDTVKTVEKNAFYGCTGLIDMVFPKSVTIIDETAFAAAKVKNVYFYNANTSIPNLPKDTVIYGYSSSTAKEYATKNGNKFVPLDNGTVTTSTTTVTTVKTTATTTVSAISTSAATGKSTSANSSQTTTSTSIASTTVTTSAAANDKHKNGDMNEDGAINLKDVVLLRRFIAGGWNVTLDEKVADVNKDGAVNLKDVVLLRRYIAGGWNVTL